MIFISKNLEFLRKRAGLKQSDLSEKLGIKPNTISNYEKGVSQPDYKILERIMTVFSVSADQLLYNDLSIIDTSRSLIYKNDLRPMTCAHEPNASYNQEEDFSNNDVLLNMIKKKDEEVANLNKLIGKLEYQIEDLTKKLDEESTNDTFTEPSTLKSLTRKRNVADSADVRSSRK